MIQIHIIRNLFIHYVCICWPLHFVSCPKDTSMWGWALGPCVQNQKSGHGSNPPPRPAPALLLVSWPGREAPCHALKCRHKTPAPPAIKCAEWQLCRRSGRCGPALYCSGSWLLHSNPALTRPLRWPLYLLLGLVIPVHKFIGIGIK